MNNKKIPFILMGISFVLILSGCVSSFIISLQEDQQRVQARVSVVNDDFEEFSTNVSIFEEKRDEIYTTYLGNLYYESLLSNDMVIKNTLSNYENIVDTITKQTKGLDKLCTDVYYPDSSVNNKCVNYKSIYEQVNNYFVSDINLYNKNIKDYNNYMAAAGSLSFLNEYKTSKIYIDYNEDKEYDGKED